MTEYANEFGALRPLGRSSFAGAALVGAIVGALVGVGIAFTMLDFPLTGDYAFLAGVFACTGVVAGLGFRLRHRRGPSRSSAV
jgi:hypothetical protein